MKRLHVFLMAALAGLIFSLPQARAMMANVPIQIVVGQADRVIIGEVTEISEPIQQNIQLPYMKAPQQMWTRTYKVKVTEDIKPTSKAEPRKKNATKKAEEKITLIAQVMAPQQSGGPRLMIADGPIYPNLQKGQKYALVLQDIKGRKELFLPSYPKNFVLASNENRVTEIKAAADASKWNWSKPVKGLQMAIQTPETVRLTPGRRAGKAVEMSKGYIQTTIALRNTTKKDIYISLYPKDHFMEISFKEKKNTTNSADLYSGMANRRLQTFGPKYTHCIPAGKIIFINHWGVDHYGLGFSQHLTPGKWKVTVKINLKRDSDNERKALWTGELEATSNEMDVIAPLPRPEITPRDSSR